MLTTCLERRTGHIDYGDEMCFGKGALEVQCATQPRSRGN